MKFDLSANLISITVSASHRKLTHVHARHGQKEPEVDPSIQLVQLATTRESIWPGLEVRNASEYWRTTFHMKYNVFTRISAATLI